MRCGHGSSVDGTGVPLTLTLSPGERGLALGVQRGVVGRMTRGWKASATYGEGGRVDEGELWPAIMGVRCSGRATPHPFGRLRAGSNPLPARERGFVLGFNEALVGG